MAKKKTWYKLVYKYTIKLLLNILTLHFLRRLIINNITANRIASKVNSLLGDNVVVIAQTSFYDREGNHCYNGGAERYVQDLAKIIKNNGCNPILLQFGYKHLWQKECGNLRIIGIPSKDEKQFILVLKYLKNFRLVIYSGMIYWGDKLLHPNIMISHGITWDHPSFNAVPGDIYNIIKDVDEIVSVDTNTISWLRSTFAKSLKERKMYYIPNYVDTNLYKPIPKNNKNIKIVFPRRAAPERGYWLMSKVLPNILNKYKKIEFDFVGFAHGDDIVKDIKNIVKMFPDRIRHYVIEPQEMVKVYQQADISLVPTLYSEGTSLSCLEAMACGNVVIATNIGGLPQLVIDGYNGLLINPDAQELQDALDEVLSDANLRKTLATNAVKVARVFDKSIWDQRWNKIINRNL